MHSSTTRFASSYSGCRISTRTTGSVLRVCAALLKCLVGLGGNLGAHVPQLFRKEMFHALMQHFNGSSHRAHNSAPYGALRQLEMIDAAQLTARIKVHETLGHFA